MAAFLLWSLTILLLLCGAVPLHGYDLFPPTGIYKFGMMSMFEYFNLAADFSSARLNFCAIETSTQEEALVVLIRDEEALVFRKIGSVSVGTCGEGAVEVQCSTETVIASGETSNIGPYGLVSIMHPSGSIVLNGSLEVTGQLVVGNSVVALEPGKLVYIGPGGSISPSWAQEAEMTLVDLDVVIGPEGTLLTDELIAKGNTFLHVLPGGLVLIPWNGIKEFQAVEMATANVVGRRSPKWYIMGGSVIIRDADADLQELMGVTQDYNSLRFFIPTYLNNSGSLDVQGSGELLWHTLSTLDRHSAITIGGTTTFTLKNRSVHNGSLYAATGTVFQILPNSSFVGTGVIQLDGAAIVAGNLDVNNVQFNGPTSIMGNVQIPRIEFAKETETMIGEEDLQITTSLDVEKFRLLAGRVQFAGNTNLTSSDDNTNGLLRVGNAKLSLLASNSEKVALTHFRRVNLRLTLYNSIVDFGSQSRAIFVNSSLHVSSGILHLHTNTSITFESTGPHMTVESGDVKFGAKVEIEGDLENNGTLSGLQAFIEKFNRVKNQRFDLGVIGFQQGPNGKLRIRRDGSRRLETLQNSVLHVQSADVDGIVEIENDEGLRPGDRLVIMQRRPESTGTLIVRPTARAVGFFLEDAPLRIVVEGDQVVVIAQPYDFMNVDFISSSQTLSHWSLLCCFGLWVMS